jgi:hypothetical protein
VTEQEGALTGGRVLYWCVEFVAVEPEKNLERGVADALVAID